MVDVPGLDLGSAESNLLEAGEHGGAASREGGGVRELPEAEVEGAQGGDVEDVEGEGQGAGEGAVDEDKVLDSPRGDDPEPVLENAEAHGQLHEAAGEAHEADGAAPAAVEDAGDGVGDGWPVDGRGAAAAAAVAEDEEVGVVEDERRGDPDAAPAPGERGGARCVLGGEARHDVGEHRAREAADAVLAAAAAAGAVGATEGTGGAEGRGGEAGEDDA